MLLVIEIYQIKKEKKMNYLNLSYEIKVNNYIQEHDLMFADNIG